MADAKTLRIVTIAVWAVAIVVIAGLVFMRGAAPKPAAVSGTGALPIMYEFSSDT